MASQKFKFKAMTGNNYTLHVLNPPEIEWTRVSLEPIRYVCIVSGTCSPSLKSLTGVKCSRFQVSDSYRTPEFMIETRWTAVNERWHYFCRSLQGILTDTFLKRLFRFFFYNSYCMQDWKLETNTPVSALTFYFRQIFIKWKDFNLMRVISHCEFFTFLKYYCKAFTVLPLFLERLSS